MRSPNWFALWCAGVVCLGCNTSPIKPQTQDPQAATKADTNLDKEKIVAQVQSIKRQGDHVLVIRKIPLTGSRIPVNVEYENPDPTELRQQLFIIRSSDEIIHEPPPPLNSSGL